MKWLLGLVIAMTAVNASAKELQLLPKCEEKIRQKINEDYGANDETFWIVGVKLLYGGSVGGLHYPPVVIVESSDEVEPRHFLVVTEVNGDKDAEENGCHVEYVKTVGDGLLPDISLQ